MAIDVDLTSVIAHLPAGAKLPATFEPFGAWLAKQTRGAVGWFDGIAGEPLPRELLPDETDLARAHSGLAVFLALPDGSKLALWYYGADEPAVVLLGSEGELATVEVTFRAFLDRLARGETGVSDLDDGDAGSGRGALATWLERHPRSARDDGRRPAFARWLGSGEIRHEGVPRPSDASTLAALVERLPGALGRPIDHPVAAQLLEAIWDGDFPAPLLGTTYLGNKPGGFCVYLNEHAGATLVEGCFFYAGGTEGYARFAGTLPFNASFDDDRDALIARLGPPGRENRSKKTGRLTAIQWSPLAGTFLWISLDVEGRIENLSLLRPTPA